MSEPAAGFKKIEEKQTFSEIETMHFELNEDRNYQHKIEHYTGKDNLIVFDEQFLLDDSDDPEQVLKMLKKKQERLNQMEEEEKKLSDSIKRNKPEPNQEPKQPDEESEAFKKIKDYLK